MNIAIILLILALLVGGVGLFVEALRWILIIALVLLLVGAVTGWRGRSTALTQRPAPARLWALATRLHLHPTPTSPRSDPRETELSPCRNLCRDCR